MKKRTTIILLILIFTIYASNTNVQITAEENNYRPTSLELTPHDPISINSDSGFEVFPGSGTEEDPYVIEGYSITTSNDYGIYIYDTTKYFVIRNCYVDAKYSGIYIDDVADGTATVINNTCSYNSYNGILLWSSGSSTVANNTCINNIWGIYLSVSGSSTVANNTCDNNGNSIELHSSGSSTVANNTCNNNNYGIKLCYSDSLTVVNNTCINNNYGIFLDSSDSSTVANNTCSNNGDYGILLAFSGSSTVANNTCSNNGDYSINLASSGSSTVANNIFTNCGLCINEATIDAYISYTVENNWVNGKKLGFYTNLDSTIISEPVYGQLILVNCTNVTVREQILNNATVGLSLYSCTYSVIINNTCNNGDYGIYLKFSGSSTVANNTCSKGDNGIFLSSSNSSTVANNTCSNNNYGIKLYYSNLCVVTYNLLQENEGYGVFLYSDSDNNLFHHNTFVDNNLGGTSQALDAGANNTWYDTETLEGNYWSDWSGIGSYFIDGSADSEDLYPLDEPTLHTVVEYQLNFAFTLLMLVVPLILTMIISKKTKKEKSN